MRARFLASSGEEAVEKRRRVVYVPWHQVAASVLLIGSCQYAVQSCDAIQLQAVAAPVIQRTSQIRTLVAVEYDQPARPGRFELHADLLGSGRESELVEQHIALVPGHLDDRASHVDSYSVERVAFHAERAYIGPAWPGSRA